MHIPKNLISVPRHKKWRGVMLYRPKFWVSVRQRFIIKCPLHNSDTVWDISTNLHSKVKHY